MTALLTRLRIAGFKSFAEPVALDILPGLTGIVGPNGCGKSNVVEALRWAMGESSPRSLRGGEMDDVIFAGTAARASRNLAEVSITLQRDGGGDALPDPFGAEEELTVTRRIERGAGSAYRGNGRDMRARDVQTLFADLASGAKSSAMVSQGRVSALVSARPEERRTVLEEAAGITGLHARRHEAELKLRAAEANLTKAEDLRNQLETGRETLRKQARQAARYRNISGLVRAAETDFLAILHARAALAAQAAADAQASAIQAALAAERAAQQAAVELDEAEAALPAPRAAEAYARSLLERRRLEAETLAQEAGRAEKMLDEANARLATIQSDLDDATAMQGDAQAAVTGLAAEAARLRGRLDGLPAEIAAARAEADAESAATSLAESRADESGARAAEAAAASRQAALAVTQAASRAADAAAALAHAQAACDAARQALIDPATLQAARDDAARAACAADAARQAVTAAEQHRAQTAIAAAAAKADLARDSDKAANANANRLEAESRLARLESALSGLQRDLDAAAASLVPHDAIGAARAAEAAAKHAETNAERAAAAAEQIHTDAGAAHLRALTARDQAKASRTQLDAAVRDAGARHHRLAADADSLSLGLAEIQAAQPAPGLVAAAQGRVRDAAAAAAQAQIALARCADGRALADSALAESRAEASLRAAEAARLLAETEGVRHALGGTDMPDSAALLDSIEVPAGLEAAFGAVLADAPDTLENPDEPGTARFWRLLPGLPAAPAPAGCTTMATLVRAPAALARALSRAALLPDGADGDAVQTALAPGWLLVSARGDRWQWDGQVSRAGAPNAAAARLRLRARLRELAALLDDAAHAKAAAARDALAAEADAATAAGFEAEARTTLTLAEAALAGHRKDLAALAAEADGAAARMASLGPALARAQADRDAAHLALRQAAEALAAMPDAEAAEVRLRAAAAATEASRQNLAAARAAREAARAALAEAGTRLRALEAASARAESQVAALLPQRDRLAAERQAAAAACDSCALACDGLADLTALQDAAMRTDAAARAAAQALTAAQSAAETAEQAHSAASARMAALDRAASASAMEAAAAGRSVDSARAAHARETAAHDALRAAQAALPEAAVLAEAAAEARKHLAETRARAAILAESVSALNAAHAEAGTRLPAVTAELQAWRARHEDASRRRQALTARGQAARVDCDALAQAPRDLSARAADSGTVLAAAETRHADAAQALRAAEDRLRDAARAQRDAEAAQSACRETVARGEGGAAAARAALQAVLERAAERLGPDAALPDIALPDPDGTALAGEPEEERARRKLDRLQRERDEMGPVNLCADLELAEIDARIAGIEADCCELTTAIAKLRGGIGHLNREGRQRLTEVFTQVDTHFRALFTRMMGGGRAHLALTGSDDPLEAGLEIYAEPPGKKLSSLSLLSGGEQALTALSLIFAVFRCTPAPVAVLDEVDAPLDDVNVDRFCALLEDVVRDTGTRFLVVTHHQLTMSRMDRLYGVTMQERGVSRLLSVDLRRAAEMVEPVMHAAE
jgi:chromosome segregation protein